MLQSRNGKRMDSKYFSRLVVQQGAYSLSSQKEAETLDQQLWGAYGNTKSNVVHRPFGTTFVNGWHLDIETFGGIEYYQYLIHNLQSNFNSVHSNRYYITGAPRSPIPEPNMQQIIANSQFEYLWVQFYTILAVQLLVTLS